MRNSTNDPTFHYKSGVTKVKEFTESKGEKSDNLKAESSQFVEMNSGENQYYTFVNMINGNTTGLSAEV